MRRIGFFFLAALLVLTGCAASAPNAAGSYRQIDQETAKEMMARDDGHVIVDVRRPDEYESGHIPGALCIPNESIEETQPEELPNLEQLLLIYCRSGNRSKQAAEKLARMGYTNLYEFGGIIDWTGEVAAGQALLLTVASNPTTGYSWAAEQDGELFDIRSWYVAEPQDEPVSGAGGWQSFLLTPTAPGTARVSFTYARPWEAGGADIQFTFTVEISDALGLTVTGDDSADAAEQGFAPTVRVY